MHLQTSQKDKIIHDINDSVQWQWLQLFCISSKSCK